VWFSVKNWRKKSSEKHEVLTYQKIFNFFAKKILTILSNFKTRFLTKNAVFLNIRNVTESFFSKNYKNDRTKDQNSTTQYQSNLDIPLRIQEVYFSSSIFNVETIIRLKKYHLHFVSFLRSSPDGPSPTGNSLNSPRGTVLGYGNETT